ncbi:hypothetical protein [Tissierella sp. Yu-01]|uniref:hypothetical protein n=1 Tax=Tissierella sp. Yu-01 TaxID=3035694 RepID=UPI00240CFB76|nr:hypothetical protein [Tissierella sp. Yu-01]WFA09570.1 hypothetical protein P3962_03180 [Tissierella sp. Yu-01]
MKNNKNKIYTDHFLVNLPTRVEVKYYFDNIDLDELGEEEMDQIANDLEQGYIQGSLIHYDENSKEYQGWWKLKQIF